MNSFALRPGWSPLNIAIMVVAFIIFWPLGLAMLAYIIWGDRFPALAADAKEKLGMNRSGRGCQVFPGVKPGPVGVTQPTGNVAFDEFRATEIARLEEERRKLDEMRDEFDDYLRELRRAKDREEFERFMADRRRRQSGASDTGSATTPSVPDAGAEAR